MRPWWLYRDYRSGAPTQRYHAGWEPQPEFKLVDALLYEPDNTPTVEVRVCREEAQANETGHVRLTDRKPAAKDAPLPPGRWRQLPLDPGYAKENKMGGQAISCRSRFALDTAPDCGCGVGLEQCLPSSDLANGPTFVSSIHNPIGLENPLAPNRPPASAYFPMWWSQEARHFFDQVWRHDMDVRELLTGKWTVINGPLAQFYRSAQPGNCCAAEGNFGMLEETAPLFNPTNVPAALLPHDVRTWSVVKDRGPNAAGLLTMPIYLEKYASARARAATLYSAFLCKAFVAENIELPPSAENDLTKRPGCSTCHATLEPLAAYFARIESGNFVFLPPDKFPIEHPLCKRNDKGVIISRCTFFYDPAFTDGTKGVLRGAYASHAHADSGPAAAAREIVASDDFAACVASRVSASFIGRPLGADDAAMQKELTNTLRTGGYRIRPLVRAIVRADAYRRANNVESDEWRRQAGASIKAGER